MLVPQYHLLTSTKPLNQQKIQIRKNTSYFINQELEISSEFPDGPLGYSDNFEGLVEFEVSHPIGNYALGDIDQDGFDELIEYYDTNNLLYVSNYNGSLLDGFPIQLECYNPLIADIVNDNHPEIICLDNNEISVVSYNGQIEFSFPNYGYDIERILLNENNQISFINGNKAITFNQEVYNDNIYWSNINSRTYNYPAVQGPNVEGVGGRKELNNFVIEESQFGIDVSRAYNYPNPFSGVTKFRYFVGSSQSVEIKIYDAAGFLVDIINDNELIGYEYNEIAWNANSYAPGLYFGALKSDANETKLIKILITE